RDTQSGLPPIQPSAALLAKPRRNRQQPLEQSTPTSQHHTHQSSPSQQPPTQISLQNDQPSIDCSPPFGGPQPQLQSHANAPLLSSPSSEDPAPISSPSTDIAKKDDREEIVPCGDGFWPHKPVIKGIADCIKSKFEEGKPRWKKMTKETINLWWGEFTRRFRWDPSHNATIRKKFEEKGAGKLSQLFQQVRREGTKPVWMGETAYVDLVKIWESSEYKKLSETNKRNRDACAGASLHTGGSIPHQVQFRRMENFKRKKLEISTQNSVDVENSLGDDAGQLQHMPSDLQIWVDAMGGNKREELLDLVLLVLQ
ncbi:hypothetical protein PIB30_080785, partial [Stylosanthes scabra]|nr:hypothetical protein [Stylosanthes scabra]